VGDGTTRRSIDRNVNPKSDFDLNQNAEPRLACREQFGQKTHRDELRPKQQHGHRIQKRRPLVRFFACEEDVSHEAPDTPLPEKIASGAEPFYIIGAIAGG